MMPFGISILKGEGNDCGSRLATRSGFIVTQLQQLIRSGLNPYVEETVTVTTMATILIISTQAIFKK